MFEGNFLHEEPSMKKRKSQSENSTFIRGFTIAECLIGLAISAILLAAVAAAFSASLNNYRENERMYETINSARQALTRMTSQLRTGHAVQTIEPNTQCSFRTAANEDITYLFRSADRKLYLRMNATGREYVLCSNVTNATFGRTLTDGALDCKSVQIALTVENGGLQRTLSAAAVLRQNLGREDL
jgi:prepilin-type N-terminal cleavage/methylation domain-containing protein